MNNIIIIVIILIWFNFFFFFTDLYKTYKKKSNILFFEIKNNVQFLSIKYLFI
jgi:hypothetical protein